MGGNGWQETSKERATYQTSKAVILFGHRANIFENLN